MKTMQTLMTSKGLGRMLRLLALCLGGAAGMSQAQGLQDGPYVLHEPQHSEAVWVCDGQMRPQRLATGKPLVAPCGEVGGFALNASNPVAPDAVPQPRRWAAVSDIHGQSSLFMQLLKAHAVVDGAGHWQFGDGVLVINGDVFDRGPEQTEALWAIYRLQQEAGRQGGSVQMVLGNHETLVLRGDLRYLHPKYHGVATLLQRRFQDLYGPDTELGQWLRSRATLLKLGDTLFLHGGVSAELPHLSPELAGLNAKVRSHLGESRASLKQDPVADWLYASMGPLWYRGYFNQPRMPAKDVDAVLRHFGVQRLVVGHTTMPQIRSLYGGRVIGIDSDLKGGKNGELLLWEGGQLLRGLLDGSRHPLLPGDDDGSKAIPPATGD